MPRAVIASQSDATRDPLDPRIAPVVAPVIAPLPDRSPEKVSPPVEGVPPGERFARPARMTTPAEFDRCLRRPPTYRNGPFALHLHWIDAPGQSVWRLGLVVPKRYEPTAVGRNTVKRRWRDAFRRGRGAWAGEFGSADVVVRLQTPLVPKAKPAVKRKVAATIATAVAPVAPANVRARERFDPSQLLDGLVGRLRARGGRPAG